MYVLFCSGGSVLNSEMICEGVDHGVQIATKEDRKDIQM